jgi:myo-inositol-1-phosphate synthase
VGAWLVGARGAISTCLVYGLAGLRQGLIGPTGLCTEREPLDALPLVPLEGLVLGGSEVSRGDLSASATELVRAGVLSRDLVGACAADAAAYDGRVRPGVLDGPEVGHGALEPESARLGGAPPREQIARVRADLEGFREENGLDRVVVVNLASTEAWRDEEPEWESLAVLEAALDEGRSLPASSVYAYAALDAGMPYVNFTPSRGASLPALVELAEARGVPHCGNDGKTGETLVKTVLAPMFRARALNVLAWQGYNMLGNKDGEVLSDPVHKEAKLRNKDAVLREILDQDELHTHVGIDFVPSLGDWKTAWDFIHFEGFLGARMSMEFTWRGSDSALAAPLVLDLVRLADLAAERGEAGAMPQTACFFKSPLGGGTHDFHAQWRALEAWAERARG